MRRTANQTAPPFSTFSDAGNSSYYKILTNLGVSTSWPKNIETLWYVIWVFFLEYICHLKRDTIYVQGFNRWWFCSRRLSVGWRIWSAGWLRCSDSLLSRNHKNWRHNGAGKWNTKLPCFNAEFCLIYSCFTSLAGRSGKIWILSCQVPYPKSNWGVCKSPGEDSTKTWEAS